MGGSSGRAGLDLEEQKGGDPFRLPLQRERLDRFRGDGGADEPVSELSEEYLTGSRRLLQPRRDVDGVARHERLSTRGVAGDDLTGGDPDPRRDRHAVIALELLVQRRERRPHLGSGSHCPQGVVLVDGGDPEDGHHRVADELLHDAAVPLQDRLHLSEVSRHQPAHRLGV